MQQITGNGQASHADDPLFIDKSAYNLRIRGGSPAMENGILHTVYQRFFDLYGMELSLDVAGSPRLQGPKLEIGAFELDAPPPPGDPQTAVLN